MSNAKYLSIFEEIKRKGGSLDGGEPNDKVLIIDGLNTFIRVFSVIPTTNDDGIHVGGIVGFLRSIGYTINMFRPTRVIIVFDGKGTKTEGFYEHDSIQVFFSKKGTSADQIIERLVGKYGKKKKITIASRDKAVLDTCSSFGAIAISPNALRESLESAEEKLSKKIVQ